MYRADIKLMAFVMSAMFWGSWTQANELYMEQVGDSSTITITQDGASNRIGTANDPIYIGSGSNNVTIDQLGAGNELDLVVNGAATDVIIDINGDNNISTVNCGTTLSAGCSGSFIKQAVTGSDNIITQNLGSGANHNSEITIVGSSNSVTHTSTNTGITSANITVSGDTNTIGVAQSGTTAKSVTVNSTGNLNNISITQTN